MSAVSDSSRVCVVAFGYTVSGNIVDRCDDDGSIECDRQIGGLAQGEGGFNDEAQRRIGKEWQERDVIEYQVE